MRVIRFSEALRTFRERDGLSQEQVAKFLGIRQQSYSDYEDGKSRPKIEKLKRLAVLFHVSIEELLGISEW